MYQPVMATTVVYMQKLLGRKAVGQGERVSTASPHFTCSKCFTETLQWLGKQVQPARGDRTQRQRALPKYQPPSLEHNMSKSLFERHSNRKKQEAATETGLEIVTQRTKFESTLILS